MPTTPVLLSDAEAVAAWASGAIPTSFRVRASGRALRPLVGDGAVVSVVRATPRRGDVVVACGGARLSFRRVTSLGRDGAITLRAELAPEAEVAVEPRSILGVVTLAGPVANLAARAPALWTKALWRAATFTTGVRDARALMPRLRARATPSHAFLARALGDAADAARYTDFHARARRTPGRVDLLPEAPRGDARPTAAGLFTAGGALVATELLEWLPDDALYIGTLYVDPQHRREGAATALMRFIVELARSHGVRRIRAHVHLRHPASERLHAKLGFAPTGAWLAAPGDPFAAMDYQLREWALRLP